MMCLFGRPRPFRYPFAIISQGKIREQDRQKFVANRQLGGPAKLIIQTDSAVVLERYGQITRIEGPGIVFLERFERIREILDLRPQTRSETPSARIVYTKDGIPVEAEITVRFQLRHGPPTPEKPYPVDPDALETATKAEAMRYNGVRPLFRFNWQYRVMGNFGSTLRAIAARMTLDELFEPADVNKDPRDEISREMLERLRQQCAPLGVTVLDVILGPFKPVSPQVEQQLRQAWQALQRADIKVEQAYAKAETLLAEQTAYAYAQLEMILAIDRGFQRLVRQNESLPSYFIALHFIEKLRRMATSSSFGMFLPKEAIQTLEFLNNKLLGVSASSDTLSSTSSSSSPTNPPTFQPDSSRSTTRRGA
jgi:regulator of protease activity HflC (stomatin/prohibitin superfamily)